MNASPLILLTKVGHLDLLRLGVIPAARPVIERLRLSGLYLDDDFVAEVLKRQGE